MDKDNGNIAAYYPLLACIRSDSIYIYNDHRFVFFNPSKCSHRSVRGMYNFLAVLGNRDRPDRLTNQNTDMSYTWVKHPSISSNNKGTFCLGIYIFLQMPLENPSKYFQTVFYDFINIFEANKARPKIFWLNAAKG